MIRIIVTAETRKASCRGPHLGAADRATPPSSSASALLHPLCHFTPDGAAILLSVRMAVLPHVVVHVAVSLEGATTGFDPDVGLFYELCRTWREDVTLAGADTILAQEQALAAAPRPGPPADGPLPAV